MSFWQELATALLNRAAIRSWHFGGGWKELQELVWEANSRLSQFCPGVCADLDCYQTQTLPSHSWKPVPLLWRLQTMKRSSSTPIGILTWEVQLHLPRASLACAIFRHWLTAFSSIPSVLRHGLCCVWAEMGGSESWMVYRHINPGVELNHSVVSLATSYSHKSQNCLIAYQSPFITPQKSYQSFLY